MSSGDNNLDKWNLAAFAVDLNENLQTQISASQSKLIKVTPNWGDISITA